VYLKRVILLEFGLVIAAVAFFAALDAYVRAAEKL
jgi:hypothetical protein